jgi:hypothetical protein
MKKGKKKKLKVEEIEGNKRGRHEETLKERKKENKTCSSRWPAASQVVVVGECCLVKQC